MGSIPLNHLLKIGADALQTTAQTLSGAINELLDVVSGKANKVSDATNGNFVGLDSNGNLVDSGKKASDFMMASDGSDKADISAIGTNETGTTASKGYAVGEHFYKNGKFCTCTQSIAQGAQFTLGTNYVEGTVASVLKRDDFITTSPYYQSSKDSYLTINGRHYIKTTSVPCYSCCYLDTSNNTCPLFISTYPDGVHYYVPPVSGVNPEAHFEYVQTFVEHNKTRWFCNGKEYAMGANVSGDRKLSGKYDTIESAANALLSIIYG